MPSGTVKFFNDAKGFGFVTLDEGGKDVFLPAVSVTSSGLSGLKAGQRISFDVQPDGKGPKAVDLKLLAGAPPPAQKPQTARPPEPRSERPPTLYCDPASDTYAEILAEFRAAGIEPRLVNYMEAPPSRDELKRLSALMRDSGQSLVRQFDPLFQALNLDDRFISENEYWDGIVEHPALINGPLVSTATKAAVCRSKDAVKAFLATPSSKIAPPPSGRKSISPRLLQLMGGVVSALPITDTPAGKIEKPAAKPLPVAHDPVVVKTIKAAIKPETTAAPAKSSPKGSVEKKSAGKKVAIKKPAENKAAEKKPAGKKPAEKKNKAKPAVATKAKKAAKVSARTTTKKSNRSARK
jgi:arsenate reductase